jgi:hypothetical protein
MPSWASSVYSVWRPNQFFTALLKPCLLIRLKWMLKPGGFPHLLTVSRRLFFVNAFPGILFVDYRLGSDLPGVPCFLR